MMQGTVVDVSASIAMYAAKLNDTLKIPLADSIILATARDNSATLWTQDSDFEGIDDVMYVANPKGS